MGMVDTGCKEFVGDGLYLINTGYGHQIKALQAQPDGIWARSSDQVSIPHSAWQTRPSLAAASI